MSNVVLVGKSVVNDCIILKTDRRPDLTYFIFFFYKITIFAVSGGLPSRSLCHDDNRTSSVTQLSSFVDR